MSAPKKKSTSPFLKKAAGAKPDLVALANEKMKARPGLSYTSAFAQAMQEHPEVK